MEKLFPILEKLGGGGMGVVYRLDRSFPRDYLPEKTRGLAIWLPNPANYHSRNSRTFIV